MNADRSAPMAADKSKGFEQVHVAMTQQSRIAFAPYSANHKPSAFIGVLLSAFIGVSKDLPPRQPPVNAHSEMRLPASHQ
jgi:hypothetical protein